VTCTAHMRHSAASTIAASCVCQTYQLHRYLKRHLRRSMLLRPHARQHWLANCRSRSGSSLGAGSGGGRKATEPAHGSVLFQTASPPQHAKFQWSLTSTEASKVSCVWAESTPPNNAISRVSVFDEWPIQEQAQKVYLPGYFFCCTF
jgi:hypothetical protein